MISGKIFERRKTIIEKSDGSEANNNTDSASASYKPSTDLPIDFLRLAEETLAENYKDLLESLKEYRNHNQFLASGQIYEDEILFTVTLSHGPDQIHSTTFYASADFTVDQELPKIDDVFAAALNACGSVIDACIGTPEKLEALCNGSLSNLEEAPLDWTGHVSDGVALHVKVDRTNPILEQMALDLLEDESEPENKEAEQFFSDRILAMRKDVSGKGNSNGSSSVH